MPRFTFSTKKNNMTDSVANWPNVRPHSSKRASKNVNCRYYEHEKTCGRMFPDKALKWQNQINLKTWRFTGFYTKRLKKFVSILYKVGENFSEGRFFLTYLWHELSCKSWHWQLPEGGNDLWGKVLSQSGDEITGFNGSFLTVALRFSYKVSWSFLQIVYFCYQCFGSGSNPDLIRIQGFDDWNLKEIYSWKKLKILW